MRDHKYIEINRNLVQLQTLAVLVLQVERILLQHPGVKRCVVIGIPDSRLTEKTVACVQLEEDWQWYETNHELLRGKIKQHLSSAILREHCMKCNLTG